MSKEIPIHAAIIMDGNRRWAKAKELPTREGHKRGIDALEKAVKAAVKFKIKYLTVFALSTENLKNRSGPEISFLFSLLEKGIKERLAMLDENGVRIKFIGDLESLPKRTQQLLKDSQTKLSNNKQLLLVVALNYGARQEIVDSFKKARVSGQEISEVGLSENLYTASVPDPDLVIRTGGQRRLSNFLLWQSAYSELYFTDILWPDFDEKEFKKAIDEYNLRIRNFGH